MNKDAQLGRPYFCSRLFKMSKIQSLLEINTHREYIFFVLIFCGFLACSLLAPCYWVKGREYTMRVCIFKGGFRKFENLKIHYLLAQNPLSAIKCEKRILLLSNDYNSSDINSSIAINYSNEIDASCW